MNTLYTYDYTSGGTIDGFVYDGAYNATKLRNVAVTPSYGVNNQLVGTGYGYDGDGNTTSYAGNTLGYDEESRLGSVQLSSGTIPSHLAGYQGSGVRAWRWGSGTPIAYFIYDEPKGHLLYEMETNGAGGYKITNLFGWGATAR